VRHEFVRYEVLINKMAAVAAVSFWKKGFPETRKKGRRLIKVRLYLEPKER
jgi:hypothetical protein